MTFTPAWWIGSSTRTRCFRRRPLAAVPLHDQRVGDGQAFFVHQHRVEVDLGDLVPEIGGEVPEDLCQFRLKG